MMIVTRKTGVDRYLAGAVVGMTLVFVLTVVYFTYGAAVNEFQSSVRAHELSQRAEQNDLFGYMAPLPASVYRHLYRYGWVILLVAVLWALCILRKPVCSLLVLVCYVGACFNLTLAWLVFTLLGFYFHNQLFYW